MDAPASSSIAHLPFLEALAGMTESSPQWQRTLAGFLTLRFVEKWADTTDGAPAPLLKEINAVHRAVDDVDGRADSRAARRHHHGDDPLVGPTTRRPSPPPC